MTLGLTLYIAVNTFLEYISCGVSKSTEVGLHFKVIKN